MAHKQYPMEKHGNLVGKRKITLRNGLSTGVNDVFAVTVLTRSAAKTFPRQSCRDLPFDMDKRIDPHELPHCSHGLIHSYCVCLHDCKDVFGTWYKNKCNAKCTHVCLVPSAGPFLYLCWKYFSCFNMVQCFAFDYFWVLNQCFVNTNTVQHLTRATLNVFLFNKSKAKKAATLIAPTTER